MTQIQSSSTVRTRDLPAACTVQVIQLIPLERDLGAAESEPGLCSLNSQAPSAEVIAMLQHFKRMALSKFGAGKVPPQS